MWADPNYMDEHNGFWICLQFEVTDANFPVSDPNGKWMKAACWNGGKFDWDGIWDLAADLGNPSSFRDNPAGWWPERYWTSGSCGIGAMIGQGETPPADAKFDDIECRTGVFNGIGRKLTLNIAHDNWGSITVDPDLRHPADPNTLAEKWFQYTDGTQIVLVATPISGKAFKEWTIYDPNYPGDVNHAVSDSNAVLCLTMDADYEVDVDFKCGSGLEPLLGVGLLVLTLAAVLRRLR